MSYQPHTVGDLVSALSLGVSAAALLPLVLAFADADLAYFDPRPALDRAGCRVCVETVRAKGTPRDAAVTAAALLMLLTATPGDTR